MAGKDTVTLEQVHKKIYYLSQCLEDGKYSDVMDRWTGASAHLVLQRSRGSAPKIGRYSFKGDNANEFIEVLIDAGLDVTETAHHSLTVPLTDENDAILASLLEPHYGKIAEDIVESLGKKVGAVLKTYLGNAPEHARVQILAGLFEHILATEDRNKAGLGDEVVAAIARDGRTTEQKPGSALESLSQHSAVQKTGEREVSS